MKATLIAWALFASDGEAIAKFYGLSAKAECHAAITADMKAADQYYPDEAPKCRATL